MKSVVGIFPSRADAERAAVRLRERGARSADVSILAPGESAVEDAPSEDMEQPGIGKALGGVVGGALGIAGGAQIGTAIASTMIPGVGPVVAVGMLAAAILGTGGAFGGAAAGQAIETSLSDGVPKDELFIYEDALRRGRSVLIAMADDDARAGQWRKVLDAEGAESVDAAREGWWLGLREAQKEHYGSDEPNYRSGFEAALHRDRRGKTARECMDSLRQQYGECCETPAFERGYAKGQKHQEELWRKPRRTS